jgi:hypothetical protein
MKQIISVGLLLCLHLATYAQVLERQVIASGGTDGNSYSFTIGQAVVGTSTNQSFVITQGYQQLLDNNTSVNIVEQNIVSSISTFPNPAISYFQVNASFEYPIAGAIQLHNILGERVYRKTFDKTQQLNSTIEVDQLASAVYMLNIYSETNQLLVSNKILIHN